MHVSCFAHFGNISDFGLGPKALCRLSPENSWLQSHQSRYGRHCCGYSCAIGVHRLCVHRVSEVGLGRPLELELFVESFRIRSSTVKLLQSRWSQQVSLQSSKRPSLKMMKVHPVYLDFPLPYVWATKEMNQRSGDGGFIVQHRELRRRAAWPVNEHQFFCQSCERLRKDTISSRGNWYNLYGGPWKTPGVVSNHGNESCPWSWLFSC